MQGKIPGEKRSQAVSGAGRSVGRNRVIEAGPRSFNGGGWADARRFARSALRGVGACVIAHRGLVWPVAQPPGPVLMGSRVVTRDGPRVRVGRVARTRGRFRKDGAVAARERDGLGRAGRGSYRRSVRVVAVIGFDPNDFA